MSCCMRRAKKREKRIRRIPINPLPNSKDMDVKEYAIKIPKECIACYQCKEIFKLKSGQIKINCAGCDKFFHCHIAGKCRGNCTEIFHNSTGETKHTLSYCLNCVNPMTCNGNTCLCNDCVLDEKKK